MFYCLPDSAWADGNLAEAAGQVGKSWNTQIKVNPTQVYEDLYIRNKYFPIVHSLYCFREYWGHFDCSAAFHVEKDFRQDVRNYKLKTLPKTLPKILPSFGRAIEFSPCTWEEWGIK